MAKIKSTSSKVSTLPTRPRDNKDAAAAPGAKFTEALEFWPAFFEDLNDLLGVPAHEAAHIRASAIMEGLKPLLLDGGRSTASADDREFTAQKIMVLLGMVEETIPPAAKDGPFWSASIDQATLFQNVQQSIAEMRSLVSGYLPSDYAAVAAPGPLARARGVSEATSNAMDLCEAISAHLCSVSDLAKTVVMEPPDQRGFVCFADAIDHLARICRFKVNITWKLLAGAPIEWGDVGDCLEVPAQVFEAEHA